MDATRQAFLDELYAHGRAHDEQRADRLQRLRNVEPETAELLGVLVRALGAQRVLEIGTSNGYSTIWLGDAAEAVGGSVLSLEIEAERTAQAADNLAQAGVDSFVELRTADAGAGARGLRRRVVRPDLPRRRAPAVRRLLAGSRARPAPARPARGRQLPLPRQGARRLLGAGLRRRRNHLDARDRRRGRAADREISLTRTTVAPCSGDRYSE